MQTKRKRTKWDEHGQMLSLGNVKMRAEKDVTTDVSGALPVWWEEELRRQ